jgi:hypothetical protein
MKYTVKCTDGGDSNCYKELDVDIEIAGLTDDQLDDITEHGETDITKEQVKVSGIILNDNDKKTLDEEGFISYSFNVRTICGACGSDQTYDNEGNNISHL